MPTVSLPLDQVTVLGTLASVGGLLLALVQSLQIRELKRRTSADLWESVRTLRSIVSNLEKTKKIGVDPHITSAYTAATALYRHVIKQVVLEEHNFSESTIEKWRQVGKLESPWQVSVARHFLETKSIRDSKQGATAHHKEHSETDLR